jgi:hypothetical protein
MRQSIRIPFVLLLVALLAGIVFAEDSRFVFKDLTVNDKHNGIIWVRNANLGKQDIDGANELVKELNRKKYAGYEGWRLPTAGELESLVKYANDLGYNSSPKEPYKLFNEIGFYNVQGSAYWSSSTNIFMAFSGGAWGVNMDNGSTDYKNKTNPIYVWPVRAGI